MSSPLRSHEVYAELAAGYALSALEPQDEQLFVAHLAGCASCERELRVHQETLAQLAYAPSAAEPPPALLEGIRDGVRASGRQARFDLPIVAEPLTLVGAPTRRTTARRSLPSSRMLLAAAAAMAMVLGLGAYANGVRLDRDAEQARTARLAVAVQDLGADGTRSVPLSDGDGRVLAVALVHGADMSVLLDGLPANAPGTTYVLWGRAGVELRAVGAFSVSGRGLDVVRGLHMPGDTSRLSELIMTRERGMRAPAQPGAPVLASGQA